MTHNMTLFRISMMIDVKDLIEKIDVLAIEKMVLANEAVPLFLDRDNIGVMLVCRKDWQKFKQFDHWTRKGMACYSVILPYETCLADQTNKDDLTVLGADLVVECLRQWAEKRRQKALKARPKKAA